MWRGLILATMLLALACGSPSSPGHSTPVTTPTVAPSPSGSGSTSPSDDLLLLGRIVTMADPAEVESLLIVDGRVAAMGARAEVEPLAGPGTNVVELGTGVAYPGFIDAHSHWIGDRESYGIPAAEDAVQAAISRGWTSIAELWVDSDRLAELEDLDRSGLPLRVDAYLAANAPGPDGTHFGEWYLDRNPGVASAHLRVRGVKFTIDNGWGRDVWWEPAELGEHVERAHDAGWQVAVHTVSAGAHEMVLDAFERVLDGGPNTPHHRIEHAIQVTDEELARMVALDVVTVIHLDGGASDWVLEADYLGNLGPDTAQLARWRDFVDAGLHVAAAVDAPWIFPELALTEAIGRPVDQVAGGMDGRGRANPETPAWVFDQLLTAEQGLAAITIDAAYALGDEANRGHLAPGTYGDVTILSGDTTAGTPDDIRSLRVVSTIVGGVVVYCADPVFCP